MALKGAWGTFVHIPKCGGFGFRRYLRENIGSGYEDPPYHGLPETIERGFTLVRHPVDWLRSFWTYRTQHKWEIRRRGDKTINHVNNWPAIFGLTQWAAGLSWPSFVDGLYDNGWDIVSTVYGIYRHPQVKVYRLEHVDELIADLGCTAPLPITHVTPNKPEVTRKQREKLERLCWRSIVDYGYDGVSDANYIAEICDLRRLLPVQEYADLTNHPQ